MKKCKSASKRRSAFTIVELLTVMGVIAMLIGLLVPALNLVRDYARELQQKAQFHSMEAAIEMFVANSGYGTYPPSNDNSIPPAAEPTAYGGAQKLAEALVGWDLMGYHPKSLFMSDGGDGVGTNMAYGTAGQNLEERQGPFIDLENANAFMMGDIYPASGLFNPNNYVLCDVYGKNRYSGKKTGMPILYYRARTEYFNQTFDEDSTGALVPLGGIDDDIYYYPDNMNLLALGAPDGTAHMLDGANDAADHQRFEEMILNDQIDRTRIRRPYRANSYILISAGKDGLYGTGDDLTNFTKE